MLTKLSACVFAVFAAAGTTASAQSGSRPYQFQQPSNPVVDRVMRDSFNGMREMVRQGARQHIETTVSSTTLGQYRVSSRDRAGELHSAAHDRGAIDVVTPQTGTQRQHPQAQELSRRLGQHYTVVVEEPHHVAPGAYGPSMDRNTSYRAGQPGADRWVPARATGNHTHIQPNFEIRNPWRNVK